MESRIKTKLNRDQIEKIVELNFKDIKISEIVEIPEGNIGSVYVIHTILKELSDEWHASTFVLKTGMKADADCLRYEKDLFPTELKVYQLLKGKNIPMPKVLKADLSCKLVPAGYFFMEFIEGKTWKQAGGELSTDDKKRLLKKLGEYNARISSVKGDYFGYLKDGEQHHFKTHSESFFHMINDILLDGKEHEVRLPYDEIEKVIRKYRLCLDEVKVPKLVNFDLWAGNVFLNTKETVDVKGIIDFGHCFYGDAYAAFISAIHLFEQVEQEAEFIEGYESVSGEKLVFNKNSRIRMDLYRLYMALICSVETYRYEEALGRRLRMCHLHKAEQLLEKLG